VIAAQEDAGLAREWLGTVCKDAGLTVPEYWVLEGLAYGKLPSYRAFRPREIENIFMKLVSLKLVRMSSTGNTGNTSEAAPVPVPTGERYELTKEGLGMVASVQALR
jgi:hypothetical protein